MPYRPDHKEKTRLRIIDAARRLFNRHGFEGVSIDQIMAEAGLTRGGFYHHFATKDELFSEAVACYSRCNPPEAWLGNDPQVGSPEEHLARQILTAYLSEQHLSSLDHQCPMIALPSDVARSGPAVRKAYQKLLEGMIGIFQSGSKAQENNPRGTALAITTLCVGGMVLARTIEDPALQTEIRETARDLALSLGGLDGREAETAENIR
ncbi:MAG: helix-turn-helix domain-containing protein [Pseudomonadota bacterium]